MAIELHIQTKAGRCEDEEEPSTAYKYDFEEDTTFREFSQFYAYLKCLTRQIEKDLDEGLDLFSENE
jgi:hypothetical protein